MRRDWRRSRTLGLIPRHVSTTSNTVRRLLEEYFCRERRAYASESGSAARLAIHKPGRKRPSKFEEYPAGPMYNSVLKKIAVVCFATATNDWKFIVPGDTKMSPLMTGKNLLPRLRAVSMQTDRLKEAR